ncbi:MAG: hypothetical protein JXR96_09110 [Deltaproteobacteria bacterium]|nr:hypothetical protein [Deltaproteobacteria bacterium]
MKRLLVLLALLLASPATAGTDPDLEPICKGRKPCRITGSHPAGEGLRVVELALHDRSGQSWKEPDPNCAPYEYWLVDRRKAAPVRQLLVHLCNDGYGARGMGEDHIEVAEGRFSLTQTGGSAWMWSRSASVQLAPLRVTSEGSSGWWTLGSNTEDQTWSHADFKGGVRWSAPDCGHEQDKLAPDRFAYGSIPLVEMDAAFRQSGWKSARLGSCSLAADSEGKNGFVTFGKPVGKADASFRAVFVSERELLVEVEDDRLVAGARSWIVGDHLEVWLGDPKGYMDHCLEAGKAWQWGVDLLDGKVHTAFGDPSQLLAVEREAVGSEAVRFKITFPKAFPSPAASGVAVVYSDSDDGKRQERLIASSRVAFGQAASLGRLRAIPKSEAICRVAGGRLQAHSTRRFTPDKPVLDW